MTQGWSKELLATRDWLKGEDSYQFDKNRKTHTADPTASITFILGTEIGNKWHRFQLFNSAAKLDRDSQLFLQASQQVLKACGAARGALVWDYVLQGYTVSQGSQLSFVALNECFDEQSPKDIQSQLPLLELPIDAAIAPHQLIPGEAKQVFTKLATLAAAHIYDTSERTGSLILPRPGLASGEIEAWI
jgi:hypothetical protein